MEKEALERQKIIDEQKEQKESFKRSLEEQMFNRQVMNRYNKEIEREAEKALLVRMERYYV